jgi:hypothetical protein
MSRATTTRLFAILLPLALSLSAAAQQKDVRVYRDGNTWVEETTGSIPAAHGLSLRSAVGSVQVRGAAQSNVTYTIKKRIGRTAEDMSRRDMARFEITVARRGDAVVIEGDWPGDHAGRLNAEFYVTVPRETNIVKVETLGGSVDVKNITGKAYTQTAGGSITLDDIGSSATANTMGGSIAVGKISGDAKLETAGGSISIDEVAGVISAVTSGGSISVGSGQHGITVESAGGSISVNKCGGQLRASTAGGSIDIGDVSESAHLETAGGGIRLGSAGGNVIANTAGGGIKLKRLTRGVSAETTAGPIEAEFIAKRGEFTDSHLETTVGDIVVYLPSDLAATIKASVELANGHNIFTDFDSIKVTKEGGEWGPREIYAEGRINGGGPVLKLHTTNGNIEIRKSRR